MMKIKVFSFDGDTALQMENVVNNWLLNANRPNIVKWMQSESAVWDLNTSDYPFMRTSVTITIVYEDEP